MFKYKIIFLISIVATFLQLSSVATADFVFTVNSISEDEFSFTINGFFDDDATGDQQNWLAVKSDWTNNLESNVDWIDDTVGFDFLSNIPELIVVENTIAIDGFSPTTIVAATAFEPWGDAVYFDAGFDLTAGMFVAGTLTLQGKDLFDSSATNFQLLSGFDDIPLDWNRLEANAIPEPNSSLLILLTAVMLMFRPK